ncbi:hypothetical protein GCK72_019803 [Caenorhabditis remanei]|uniref:Uncharacterized protein n=1 Tax=Caenorhabditis remanei TaxID=31234 RepID=A0A6A5GDB8_CAERE|nr:hypothetical protein GCK72_019803 [Caenorhabditis remanei]KAF1753247.1 hypothetical protein GCK72_019803 [Caenorhabditis remanei]
MEWSVLPDESKREVIKRLDFMSRLSIKDDKCLVVVYTGIDKFLRMEISKGENGCVIHKMENSYDLKKAIVKVFTESVPTVLACSILRNLFNYESTLIGTFELEFDTCNFLSQINQLERILSVIGSKAKTGSSQFNVKRFHANWMTSLQIIDACHLSLFNCMVLEEVEREGIVWETESLTPRITMETSKRYGEQIIRLNDIYMAERRADCRFKMVEKAMETENGYTTCRWSKIQDVFLWDHQKITSERLNKDVEMKRVVVPQIDIVTRWNKSKCGVWVHIMKMYNEKKYVNFFKNETCGLRYLCEKCSDPFDYWFYQNLPRRIHHEPEWSDVGILSQDANKDTKDIEMIENAMKLKKKFQDEDKKSKRKQKKQKKSKTLTKKDDEFNSWGFGIQKKIEMDQLVKSTAQMSVHENSGEIIV